MSYPVVELIAQEIFTTLGGVKEAAGFNYDLVVEREIRKGNDPTHLKAVLYQLEPDEVNEESNGLAGWMQPFAVSVFLLPLESDDTPLHTYLNVVWGDIVKALMIDPTRGGNAIDTVIESPVYMQGEDGGLMGFAFLLRVKYRTDLTDPYTQR